MKKSLPLATMLLLATTFLYSSVLSAQVTESDKKLAKVSYSAFYCSAWAELMGDEAEVARLVTIGLESGKKYISLVQEHGSKALVANSKAPSGFVMMMSGPSIDFMLGRIYQLAATDATEEVIKDGDELITDTRLLKVIAEGKYHTGNCELIR